MPNFLRKNGETIPGELILIPRDYREPSTEPSANLVGTEGRIMSLRKVVVSLLSAVLLFAAAGSVSAAQTDLRKAVNEVVGTPYKWGGTTVAGFDCSGFILHIFNQFNVKLPRTSKSQALAGMKVAREDLRPGDLVFFNTDGRGISHAGIYIGGGEFAHSSSSRGVQISKISETYYDKRYVTARRVISGEDYTVMVNDEHVSDDSHNEGK